MIETHKHGSAGGVKPDVSDETFGRPGMIKSRDGRTVVLASDDGGRFYRLDVASETLSDA